MANKYEERPEDIKAAQEVMKILKKRGRPYSSNPTPEICPFCGDKYVKLTRDPRGDRTSHFDHGTYICDGVYQQYPDGYGYRWVQK